MGQSFSGAPSLEPPPADDALKSWPQHATSRRSAPGRALVGAGEQSFSDRPVAHHGSIYASAVKLRPGKEPPPPPLPPASTTRTTPLSIYQVQEGAWAAVTKAQTNAAAAQTNLQEIQRSTGVGSDPSDWAERQMRRAERELAESIAAYQELVVRLGK